MPVTRLANWKKSTRLGICALLGLLLLPLGGCSEPKQDLAGVLARVAEYERKAEFGAAILELKAFLQEQPEAGPARLELGRMYIAVSDGVAALKELQRAAGLGEDKTRVEALSVEALILQHDLEIAVTRAQALVDRDDAAPHLSLLGDAKLLARDPISALALYDRALEKDKNDIRGLLGMGVLAASQQNFDGAAKLVKQAITLAPNYGPAHRVLGDIEYQRGNHTAALAAYRDSARLNPVQLTEQVNQLRALLALDRPDEAEALIVELKQKFGKGPILDFYAAVAAYGAGDFAKATDLFREVLSQVPQHARSQYFLGALLFREGQYAQAADMLSVFLKQVPSYVPARKMLAGALIRLDKPKDALAALDGVTAADVDGQVESLRASALMGVGRTEQGFEALQKSVDLEPDNLQNRTALTITKVLNDPQTDLLDLINPDGEFGGVSLAEQMVAVFAHVQNKRFDEALALAGKLAQEYPSNALIINAKAMAYIGKNETDKARAAFAEALQVDRDNLGILRNSVLFEFNQGRYDAARAHNERLLLLDSENVFGLTMSGHLAQQAGQTDTAIEFYERARALDSSASDPRIRLAAIFYSRAQYGQAVQAADEIVQRYPQLVDALLILGHSLLQLGQISDADIVASRAIKQYPDAAAVQYFAARVAAKQGDYEAADELITSALKSEPDNADGLALSGEVAIARGDKARAMEIIGRLEAVSGSGTKGASLRGDLQRSQGDFAGAAKTYTRVLEIEADGEVALKRFHVLRQADDTDAAIAGLAEFLLQHPDFGRGYLELAGAHIAVGANDEAIRTYESYLKLVPNAPVALNNLANLKTARGDADAGDIVKRAYDAAPENLYIQDTYGWMMVQSGDIEQGLKHLETAARGLPDNAEIAYHLGVAYSRAKNRKNAVRELERALALGEFKSRQRAADLLGALKN